MPQFRTAPQRPRASARLFLVNCQFACAAALSLALAGCSGTEPELAGEALRLGSVSQALGHAPQGSPSQGCDHDHDDEEGDEAQAVRQAAGKRVRWQGRLHHKQRSVALKVLGFNDFHGQLAARTVSSRPAGGAAVMASYLEAAQTGFEGRSLIVHAGDHVGASPPSSALLQDEPAIQFLNMLANEHCSYDKPDHKKCNIVGTLGNHEFDEGKDELARLIEGGNHAEGPFLESPYLGAKFAYVSANVVKEGTDKTLLAPYVIKELGGVKLGVIGAVLEETPTIVTPSGVAGLDFLDEAEAINRAVKKLKKKDVHAILVTIHQGGSQTSYVGETAPGGAVTGPIVDIVAALDDEVDVVVSGHAHSFTNAILTNQNGQEILVTQSFSASTAYADIDLSVDKKTGDVTQKSAAIVTTWGDEAPGTSPDPEVAELVSAAEELTAPLVNQVVGNAPLDITRTQNSAGESALGNLIADAQRAAMGTDFGFMNPGGIRADLAAGEVTWGDLFTIQPFGNSLVQMTLTGAQIDLLLEQQWLNQTSPRMLQISGLSYTWDSTQPNGEKVSLIVDASGVPLDPAAEYSVTVNSFIAAGGDNFVVLPLGTNRIGGDVDLDALIEYIAVTGGSVTAAIEGRITRL